MEEVVPLVNCGASTFETIVYTDYFYICKSIIGATLLLFHVYFIVYLIYNVTKGDRWTTAIGQPKYIYLKRAYQTR